MSNDILAMFAAKQTEAPTRGQRDAVARFKTSARKQIEKAEDEKKSPSDSNKNTLNWFKAFEGGYRLRLGKNAIKLQGATHWKVDSLDEVVALLKGAEQLADVNADFQKAIRDADKEAKKKAAAK